MANRYTLHKNSLEGFQKWLVADGWEIEKPKGIFEVLRARKAGRPQPLIVYMKSDAKEHLTVMSRDIGVVRAFLRAKKKPQTNADRIRSMTDEELAIHMLCPNEMVLAKIECEKSDRRNCYKCRLNWLRAEREG